MSKLVTYHMSELIERTFERKYHATFDELEKSADTIRYEARRCISLFEVKRGCIEDQRNSICQ